MTGTTATASATVGSTTENRVQAIAAETINAVGAGEHIAAGQRRGEAPPQQDLAQGRGVHTYYVLAGNNPVLVHNSSCPLGGAADDMGLSGRGLNPLPGTRIRPDGIPDNWRITGTDSSGGTRYFDPSNPGNSVRVMQGNPNSPYPNSQSPYGRWQQNGQPLDRYGNKLPSAKDPAAHIPLQDFRFRPEMYQ